MKNLKFIIAVLSIIVCVTPSYALVVRSGDEVVIASDESIDDDVVAFGQSLEISGKVSGDVYAFAQNVTISGEVGGTIFAGAATITINTQRAKTIWAAGANIDISANVDRNVILAGGSLLVSKDARIGRELKVYGGKCTVEGEITDFIMGSVGKFEMAGKSRGIRIKADETTIKSGALISGNLIVRSEKEPTIEEDATITGETKVERPEEREAEPFFFAFAPMVAFFITFVKIVMFIAKIIVGILLIALFKPCVRRIMDTLIRKPWQSLGWGFLGLIVIPVAAAILFVILIGYPIAIFGVYIYTILFYLSSIFVAFVVGEKVIQLFKKEGEISLYISFIIGLIVLYVLGLIPVLGFIIKILTVLFGAGMLLLGGWNLLKDMRGKKLI